MSQSITIPKRKGKQSASLLSSGASAPTNTANEQHASLSTSASSSNMMEPTTPAASSSSASTRVVPSGSGGDKGKARADAVSSSPGWGCERRASLLSSSLSKSEHTVINVGEPDAPRLMVLVAGCSNLAFEDPGQLIETRAKQITCVKTSQGFDWNQDIFLPSYISDRDYTYELEHRQDPVEDIFITEEEAEGMFPR